MFDKIDDWLDIHTFNGFNHFLYATVIVVLFWLMLGSVGAKYAYIGSVIFFYISEAKQAIDWDGWKTQDALMFWKWKWSKIQDVATVILGTGVITWWLV